MVSLSNYARWVTNVSFLLAFVLTIFLLSGTTSTTPGVRNLYVAQVELNSTRFETLTSSSKTSASSSLSSSPPTPTLTATVTIKSIISVSTAKPQTSKADSSKTSTRTPSATSKSTARKRNVSSANQSDISRAYKETIALMTEAALTHALSPTATSAVNNWDTHYGGRRSASGNYERDSNGKDPAIPPRELQQKVRGLAPNNDEGSAVLISYFGFCASNKTTPWSCTKKRNQAQTLEGAPLDLLKLGESLQGAISPLPPIIAVTLQGTLIILSCFLGFRSSTGLQTKLGKLFLVLAFAAFSASIFTAILFQSAAGMIYSAFITSDDIIASKGSGGISLAWAGVLFTGLAMAGVICLVLFSDSSKTLKSHAKEPSMMSRFLKAGRRQEPDVEMPPVRRTSPQREIQRPAGTARGELHPQQRGFRTDVPPQREYVERAEDMRQDNPSLGNEWNMI